MNIKNFLKNKHIGDEKNIFYIGDILNYSDYESRGIIEDLYLLIIKV